MPIQTQEDRFYVRLSLVPLLVFGWTWFDARLYFDTWHLNLAMLLAPIAYWSVRNPRVPLALSLILPVVSGCLLVYYWAAIFDPEFCSEWIWHFGYLGQASWFAAVGCWIAAARHGMNGTGPAGE